MKPKITVIDLAKGSDNMSYRKLRNLSFYFTKGKSEKGSFTIEASLIFPTIFLLIVTMIFVSILIYYKVTLYYIASQAAGRAAYNWNNSHKDPFTGEFAIDENDGLYWRLTDDRVFDILLGISDSYQPAQVIIDNGISGKSNPEKKMKLIANIIPKGIKGKLTYSNRFVERRITVELENPIKIPKFVAKLIGDKVSAKASSTITDPVEFIRTVDLLQYYSQKIIDNKDRVRQILSKQKANEKKAK